LSEPNLLASKQIIQACHSNCSCSYQLFWSAQIAEQDMHAEFSWGIILQGIRRKWYDNIKLELSF
jgi:hypothetical protein